MRTSTPDQAPTEATEPIGSRLSGAWLTAPRLWIVIALGGIGVMQLALAPNAIDLAYHVKAGELMVRSHELLRTDVLAWPTAGRPWLDQNWGAQLVLYGIWRLGGFQLIAVASALCTVTAWTLVVAACRQRTANLRLIAGAVLAGYLGSMLVFAARPQMFSVVLFGVELYLLEVARTRPRVALWIPLLMPLWANLHGAFVIGLALLAVELAAAAWRRDRPRVARFLLVGAASVAGLLVNPWGVRVLAYATLLPTKPAVTGMVSEWAPASLRDPAGALLLAAIGVLALTLALARAPGRAIEQILRMALLAGMALWAVRASIWFGLALPIALCVLARERPPRSADADRGVPALNGAVAATLLVAVVVVLPPVRRSVLPGTASLPELHSAPVATADWLAANPQPGRMFNVQAWGSYLEFRLGPEVQPAMDSRIELLPTAAWRDYLAITGGRWDTERLLDQWGIGYVVTSRGTTPGLVAALGASERWRLVFSQGDERVFVRLPATGAR